MAGLFYRVVHYPFWIDRALNVNLRAVDRDLFVGAEDAPRAGRFYRVVDLYGNSVSAGRGHGATEILLRWPFRDGLAPPEGLLDAVLAIVATADDNERVLIHCQAGLSRSASVAYAMLRVLRGLSDREALRRVRVREDFPVPSTLEGARKWVKRRTV